MKKLTTKTKAIIASVLFSQAAFSFADIRLELGEGVNLIAVNGQEFTRQLKRELYQGSKIKLPDGKNQLLVSYTADINERDHDDAELETSKTSVVLFESTVDVILSAPPKLNTARKIKDFDKELNWRLVNKQGKSIAYNTVLLPGTGFLLARDFEKELAEFNNTQSLAAVPKKLIKSIEEIAEVTKSQQSPAKNSSSQKTTANTNTPNMPMDMLIYWYNQADEKTRRSFKELIKNK